MFSCSLDQYIMNRRMGAFAVPRRSAPNEYGSLLPHNHSKESAGGEAPREILGEFSWTMWKTTVCANQL